MKTGKCVRRLQVIEKLRALIAKLNNRAIAEIKSYRDPGSGTFLFFYLFFLFFIFFLFFFSFFIFHLLLVITAVDS